MVLGLSGCTPAQVVVPESTKQLRAKTGSTEVSGERYVEYTRQTLNESADRRRVLFFFANWCPTCIPADANFRANEDRIPEDVVLIRVNYNDTDTDEEEKALARKYNVTYQHTFVQIDQEGNMVTIWNGGASIDDLLSRIK